MGKLQGAAQWQAACKLPWMTVCNTGHLPRPLNFVVLAPITNTMAWIPA